MKHTHHHHHLICVWVAVLGWSQAIPAPTTAPETPLAEVEVKGEAGKDSATHPKITYSKESVNGLGDRVKLDCGVEGVDLSGVNDFSVAWSKIDTVNPVNSLPISHGTQIVLFSQRYEIEHPDGTHRYSLIIKKMTSDDEGLYRCTVDFGEGQRIHANVPVSLIAAPFFTDNMTKTLTVTEGDSISIDCQPGGSPKPEVYWERVNNNLPNFDGKYLKHHQLELPMIKKEHRGEYICYADNGIGEPAMSRIKLEVEFAPQVEVPASRVFTTTNEEVELDCTVSSFPSAEISWYKDSEVILGGANMRILTTDLPEEFKARSQLTVVSVSQDDLGQYSCQATNSVGKEETSVQISIKSPPIIVKQSRKEVLYDLEDTTKSRNALPISIECEAEGAPTPNYRWTKDGSPLAWQTDPRFDIEEDTGTLLISDPTMSDNGLYQCFAYNDLGTAAGDPVYLLNVSSIYFSNDAEPSDEYNLIAELGRPYKLSCPKAYAYPEPSLTWVRSVEHEDKTELEFVRDERVVSDPNGDLWFTHITEDDDTGKNGFEFMCLANTPFKPYDFSIASVVHIAVKDPADGSHNLKEDLVNIESFPMFTSDAVVTFKAGEENTLWCIYGGEPIPEIVWARSDGKEVVPNTRVTTRNYGRTLVFNDTQLEDSGEYSCMVFNGVGTHKESVMRVVVEQAPVFVEGLKSQTVYEGSTVTFNCLTNHTGNLTYSWTLNGRKLSPRDRHLRRTIKGSRLVIAGVAETDIGNYACNASSLIGYAYGQAILNVLPTDRQATNIKSCSELNALKTQVAELNEAIINLHNSAQEQRDMIQLTHNALEVLTQQIRKEQEVDKQEVVKETQEPTELAPPTTTIPA